jgi:hypothetical protein
MNKKYDYLRKISLTNTQKQIIVGSMLGDGCLYRDNNKSNYKLSFSHCEKQHQYFNYKINLLSPFIISSNKSIDKRGNSIMLQTRTITHPELNEFANMFYDQNRIKHIPDNIEIYFTPLTLAIWIQDDGNLNAGVNIRIASMCFSESENYKLQYYLKQCFNLDSKIMPYNYKNKHCFHIVLNKENSQKLSNLINMYVVDDMKYKIM